MKLGAWRNNLDEWEVNEDTDELGKSVMFFHLKLKFRES